MTTRSGTHFKVNTNTGNSIRNENENENNSMIDENAEIQESIIILKRKYQLCEKKKIIVY